MARHAHRDPDPRPGRRDELLAFLIAFVVALVVALLQGAKPFLYDAKEYWRLAEHFVRDGTWSFLHYNHPLRGYVPALLFGGLHDVADAVSSTGWSVVKVFNALLVAGIGTVLAPRLAQIAWPQIRFGVGRRLAGAGLLLVFWRGYLNFPLSDIPALAAALVALIAVARTPSFGALLVSGLAAGLAVNVRPAYVLLVPAIVAITGWNARTATPRPGAGRGAAGVVAVLVGLALALGPQAVLNHRHFDTWSPMAGAGVQLTQLQLTSGLALQRYETYVGTGRRPQMNYLDRHTDDLRREIGHDGVVQGYGEYLGIVVDHPLVIGGVFGRHLINAMDQRYPTPYIEHLDDGGQRPLRLAGFALFFLALLRLLWPRARRSLGPARWRYVLALGLTCLTILPSAMETRFFLPGYLLAMLLVLAPGWPWREALGLRATGTGMRRAVVPGAIAAGLALFLLITLSVVSDASRHLDDKPPKIGAARPAPHHAATKTPPAEHPGEPVAAVRGSAHPPVRPRTRR